jgi:crotonobetaine/carnitine-CoA ligase
VPRYLEIVGALPKTPSEKIEKYKLKVDAAARRDQLWDRDKAGITVDRHTGTAQDSVAAASR